MGHRPAGWLLLVGLLSIQACSSGDSGGASNLSGPVTPPATVVSSLTPTFGSLLLAMGGETTIAVVARTSAGAEIAGPTVAWSSDNAAVASVSETGLVRAVSPGTTQLRVSSGGANATVGVTVVAQMTTLSGRVSAVGSGALTGMRVTVRPGGVDGGPGYVGDVAATGHFTVQAPLATSATDSATIIIDISAGPRTFRPIYARYAVAALANALQRPLLVPRAVAVLQGTHTGPGVLVGLNNYFEPACDQPLDDNCSGFFRSPALRAVTLWPEEKLPIPVAFETAVSIADSAVVWTAIRQLESDLGRSLFTPVSRDALTRIGSTAFFRDAIVIAIDAALQANQGLARTRVDATQSIEAARIEFGALTGLRSSQLLGHELGHALGFGHTCSVRSIMGRGFCAQLNWEPRAVSADAAALELAYQIRRAAFTVDPTTALSASVRGERVLELGLSIFR